MSEVRENTDQRSAVSTVIVMSATLVSRILGFVRTAAISAIFGAGGVADVILLVFNIPNNLRKLLAEGALSTAFIPELSKEIAGSPEGGGARRLSRNILGIQSIILIPLIAVSLAVPAFVLGVFETFDDPAKSQLAEVLFRWMIPYILLVSISAVMMAVHNTHGRFFVPAITPIVFSIAVIASIYIGSGRIGPVAMGIGVLAGGIAQILVQYPSYRRLGYSLIPAFNFSDPAFRRVMRRWIPILLTSSLFAINNQIALFLASWLPDKSVSSLSYAIVFFQLPFGIFSASISTVLYPLMSRQAAGKDLRGLNDSLGFGFRSMWVLLVPSAMALILLGEPIISVALQRRAFTGEDTILTARVLAAYSLGMPFVGLFNITQRALYATGETRKPFYIALAAVILDIALSIIFVMTGKSDSTSLAWANTIAFAFGATLQYIVIRKSNGFTIAGNTLMTFFKGLFGTALGAGSILIMYRILGRDWWVEGSSWSSTWRLCVICLVAIIVILSSYHWMKVEAVSIILKRGKNKNGQD